MNRADLIGNLIYAVIVTGITAIFLIPIALVAGVSAFLVHKWKKERSRLVGFLAAFSVVASIAVSVVVIRHFPWRMVRNPTKEELMQEKIEQMRDEKKRIARIYNSDFDTPLSEIEGLQGGCLAWLDSSHCEYRFKSDLVPRLKKQDEFKSVPASDSEVISTVEMLKGKFPNDGESLDRVKELVCLRRINGPDVEYVFRNEKTNVNFYASSAVLR